MAKDKPAAAAERQRKRRAQLSAKGVVSVTVTVPKEGKPLIQAAAKRMAAGEHPASAMRSAGGSNEPPVPVAPSFQPWADEDLAVVLARPAPHPAPWSAEDLATMLAPPPPRPAPVPAATPEPPPPQGWFARLFRRRPDPPVRKLVEAVPHEPKG